MTFKIEADFEKITNNETIKSAFATAFSTDMAAHLGVDTDQIEGA